jgi:hypothetical protein
MKVLKAVYIVIALGFYKWAMHEINPTHPDVPKIVRRQHHLREQWRKLWHQ